MDVLDLVVVLVGSCSNLNTSDKNVSKLSGIPLGSDGSGKAFEVNGFLDVESSIPLTVLGCEVDGWSRCWKHGDLPNEVLPIGIAMKNNLPLVPRVKVTECWSVGVLVDS